MAGLPSTMTVMLDVRHLACWYLWNTTARVLVLGTGWVRQNVHADQYHDDEAFRRQFEGKVDS